MEVTSNETSEKMPKTIRKIIHRDGTVTLLDPNDKNAADLLLSHKHVSTRRVRYRKIKSKDPTTGEIKIRVEKIEDGDTLASQSTAVLTESAILQSAIEQPQENVVEIPMAKENARSKKKKRGLKNKDTTKKKSAAKENRKTKQNTKTAKTDEVQQQIKKVKIKKEPQKDFEQIELEQQLVVLDLSDSESNDSINIKKYDPTIYEFESNDAPAHENEKLVITELRYKRVITQRRNVNTNVIEAVEILEPYEGQTLPEGIKRHRVYPLDPSTMLPLVDPNSENNNNEPELQKPTQENQVQNNTAPIIPSNDPSDNETEELSTDNPNKGSKRKKKGRAKKKSAAKETELTIDEILMFASSSSIEESHRIHKRNRVFFKWTPIEYILEGQVLMTNKVEYVPKQISIKEKIPKKKVNKHKKAAPTNKKPVEEKRFLKDNDAVAPFNIMTDTDFIEMYGSLKPDLPPSLEEIPKDLDDDFPTELLVPIKPPIVQIGDKYFLEKIENGILTQYRCTEDGKRIILVMKEDDKKPPKKKRKPSKPEGGRKIRRKKSSTSMFDATSMPNSDSLVSLPVSDFDRSIGDDNSLQNDKNQVPKSPLQILLDDESGEDIKPKRHTSPPPRKHHENPFGFSPLPRAPPAFVIESDNVGTEVKPKPKPERHVRILPLPPEKKPAPPPVKPLHLMRVSSASQIELENLSAEESESESEYEYTEDTQAPKPSLTDNVLAFFQRKTDDKQKNTTESSAPMLMTSEESGHGMLYASSSAGLSDSYSNSESDSNSNSNSAEKSTPEEDEVEAENENENEVEEEDGIPSISEPKISEPKIETPGSGVEASGGERPYEMMTAQIERETSVSFTVEEEDSDE